MYCNNCGEQNPDGAKYCSACGKSINQQKQEDHVFWENCEVGFVIGKKTKGFFSETWEIYYIAAAIGKNGSYAAGVSQKFNLKFSQPYHYISVPRGYTDEEKRVSQGEHTALVNRLVSDGWEPNDRGEEWWKLRFKRKDLIPQATIFDGLPPYYGNRFDGEWNNFDPKYAFDVKGNSGACTISNSPHKKIGQIIFRIDKASDNTFSGKQMFADGSWKDVLGARDGHNLWLFDGSQKWKMIK